VKEVRIFSKKKEVLRMSALAEPRKIAFELDPKKSTEFKKMINSKKITEIQNEAKKIKNITFKGSRNAKT